MVLYRFARRLARSRVKRVFAPKKPWEIWFSACNSSVLLISGNKRNGVPFGVSHYGSTYVSARNNRNASEALTDAEYQEYRQMYEQIRRWNHEDIPFKMAEEKFGSKFDNGTKFNRGDDDDSVQSAVSRLKHLDENGYGVRDLIKSYNKKRARQASYDVGLGQPFYAGMACGFMAIVSGIYIGTALRAVILK